MQGQGRFRVFWVSSVGRRLEVGEVDLGAAMAAGADGTVVGYAERADGSYRAFVAAGAPMTSLGTLGGNYSVAYALNNVGQAAGSSMTADGRTHAFVTSGAALIALGLTRRESDDRPRAR